MNRTLLTVLAVLGAIGLVAIFATGPKSPQPKPADPPVADPAPAEADPVAVDPAPVDDPAAPETDASAPPEPAPAPTPTPGAIGDLTVQQIGQPQPVPKLGSTDPAGDYEMLVAITPWGAGVKRIELAHHSTRALEHIPYPIQQTHELLGARQYPLAAARLVVDGQTLALGDKRWTVAAHDDASATLTLDIADAQTPVLRLERTYRITPGGYDLALDQRIVNLTDRAFDVQFTQVGPSDVPAEGGYLGDKRMLIAGYFDLGYDPGRTRVFSNVYRFARASVLEKSRFAQVWPTPDSVEAQHELVFMAMTNRYFTATMHGPVVAAPAEQGGHLRVTPLADLFPVVSRFSSPAAQAGPMALGLTTRDYRLDAGQALPLNVELYVGPKDPDILATDPAYLALGMDELIIYDIGGCCSFLTFSWLAHGLLAFLDFLHSLLADWGLAIIVLVIVVRAILHPITKRSQVNMMKFGRQMQAMQPEMERLKKKYKDNQSKLNQEMMKLYREKGVNPAAMGLGCLPMFLQMPIWIALYAMLYFAIELRHEPAFYDVFHKAAAAMGVQWSFLSDLSSPDNFFRFKPISLIFFSIDSLNIIPILMGVVFYVQQKFTQPPASPNMTDQQRQQQKIMKFMMMLFPIFLYKAPSGLTLYILASSCSGIIDSYFVRKHLKEQEEAGTLFQKKEKKPPKEGGFWDRMQKAADAKRQQYEQQRKMIEKQQGKGGKSKRK